jgi:hypothetical protein
MKACRVKIFPELSEYQAEQVLNGVSLIWEAVDENHDTLFESTDINKVIDYANENNLKVSHITKHTLE